MVYSVRNPFYLRISENTILPLYVYLDERHVHWMSDIILQRVLANLRPNILPKLKAEAGVLTDASAQKKTTVDTHRGDTYQFCYFIRKTEPHSVVIKSRNFTLAPSSDKPRTTPAQQKKRKDIARGSSFTATRTKKRKTIQQAAVANPTNDDIEMDDATIDIQTDNDDDDDDYNPAADGQNHHATEADIELWQDEEEKPKPILGLTYRGFNIYGQCLCIVVEPWPRVRSATLGYSTTPQLTTQPTLGTSVQATRTPLFLPEEPEADGDTGQDRTRNKRLNEAYLKKVLDLDNLSDDDDDIGDMLEFSQVLYNIGDSRAGAINDDEDMDGSILFGDADEFKEL